MKLIALSLLIAAPSLVACSAIIGLDEGNLEPEGCGGSDGGVCSPGAAGPQTSAPAATTGTGTPALCGNGMIDSGEECDDGNESANDGCTSCVVDCVAPAYKDPMTHHCYEEMGKDNWQNLVSDCEQKGGYLASITSQAELSFVAPHEHMPIWIGGSDQQQPLKFTWSNGEPWGFAPWIPQGPSNPNNRCVTLSPMPSGFTTEDCNAKDMGLCERSPLGK